MLITFRVGDEFEPKSTWKTATVNTSMGVPEKYGYMYNKFRFNPHLVVPGALWQAGDETYEVLSVEGPRFITPGDPVFRGKGLLPFQVTSSVQFGPFRWYRVIFGFAGEEQKPRWKSEFSLMQYMRNSRLKFLP